MIGVATSESITGITAVSGQYIHIHPCLAIAELKFVMFRCSEFTFSASHTLNITDETLNSVILIHYSAIFDHSFRIDACILQGRFSV